MKNIKIPKKIENRLIENVRNFKKILKTGKTKDLNESDTVTIIIDMLEKIFGYDKYLEITSEYKIKKEFCDIAVKINGRINYLIEVKAINENLKYRHIKQAIGYASKEGIKWIVLTNGIIWEIYYINVDEKVTEEKIFALDFSTIDPKKSKKDRETLFLLCKKAADKDLKTAYYDHHTIVNPYVIAAILQEESTAKNIARKLKKIAPSINPEEEKIAEILKEITVKKYLQIEDEKEKERIKKMLKKIK